MPLQSGIVYDGYRLVLFEVSGDLERRRGLTIEANRKSLQASVRMPDERPN